MLSIYSNAIGDLRDQAASKRRFNRPVQEARRLDRYLISDGLDAATITSDLAKLTVNRQRDYWESTEYIAENRFITAGADGNSRKVSDLRFESIQESADSLSRDTDATTANIRASAELRQSIANTRLQRVTMLLSLIAVVVAIATAMLH